MGLRTIVGVLRTCPQPGSEENRGGLDDEAVSDSGFTYERMMRGTKLSARDRSTQAEHRSQAGESSAAVARPKLSRPVPEQIDSSLNHDGKNAPEDVTENFRAGFITLFACVTFVLLIACSNVANLLLVRFSGRRRENRVAHGDWRSRAGIVRLVLESLLVSVIAGGIGAFVRGD